jgi:hypothetical protein
MPTSGRPSVPAGINEGVHSRAWDELRAAMPDEVQRALLPWEWSRERLWALRVPVTRMPLRRLRHLLDLPMWRGEDGMPFTVRPADVLAAPERHPTHRVRVTEADLRYAVDITTWEGGSIVLDGLHRVAKAVSLGLDDVAAREVSPELYPAFAASGCPVIGPTQS